MREGYLGKYKILKVLKETPEVLVLLAEHIQLNSYWIIKKINKSSNLVMREVEMLKNLRFPGIPLLADVFEEDEWLIIIKEYMPGSTLDRYFHDYTMKHQCTGLPFETVIDIGMKICTIIKYLHELPEHPIIYRDMKPGNIIIDDIGEISLIDFGISRFFDRSKEHDTEYLGTKGFASPEQYGFKQSNELTDVFGIGAVLYFLLTGDDLGKPPYRINGLRSKRNDVPQKLTSIIEKACSISMDNRHTSISDLLHDLQSLTKQDRENDGNRLFGHFNRQVYMIRHLSEGSGSTYASLMLAKSLVYSGYRPLVIDMNGELSVLEYRMDTHFEKQYLIYDGIAILSLPLKTGRQVDRSFAAEDFDCLIFDSGHEEMVFNLDHAPVHTFIAAQYSPWKMELLEEAILSLDESQVLLINGCTIEAFDELSNSIEHIKMYHLPFEPIKKGSVSDSFHQINQDQGGFTSCSPRGRNPIKWLSGINFIKNIRP